MRKAEVVDEVLTSVALILDGNREGVDPLSMWFIVSGLARIRDRERGRDRRAPITSIDRFMESLADDGERCTAGD